MQLKKIAIFTILTTFLLICSLSTISAANQTINDDTAGGIAQGITGTEDEGTLTLNPGTYNKTNNDTNITISKNITIKGNGTTNTVVIDALTLSGIFTIANNVNITFINLTFMNGMNAYGGAINSLHTSSMMTFINCSFINNTAYTGGGIITNSSLNVINSSFIENKAIGMSSSQGGAIAASGKNISIENSIFERNHAILDGGAIFLHANATVTNSNFTENSASAGGAINSNNRSSLTVITSKFTRNDANASGGGIFSNLGGNLTVIDSDFTANNANATGGGIFTTNMGYISYFTVIGSNFTENTANASGGAIRSSYTTFFMLNDSKFEKNSANNAGGGIWNEYTNMSVNNSSFIENIAFNGGGIFAGPSNTTISYSNFTENFAKNNGGGIFHGSGYFNVTYSEFTRNNADINGGGIFTQTTCISVVNSSIFTDNVADIGGGIHNLGNMSVSKNNMIGNTATLGNVIYNGGNMGILNLTYLSNSTVKTNKGKVVLVYATLTDDMGNPVTGQEVSFYLNGSHYVNLTSIEGKASFNYTITQNPPAIIPVTGDYAGHTGYSIVIRNGKIVIEKLPTTNTVSIPDSLVVGDTVTINSTLIDKSTGKPMANQTIDFFIDGNYIGSAITDENGVARINYTFNKAGNYQVSTKFDEIETHYGSNATNKTTVKKIPTITIIDVDGDKITATLTDENGNLLANKTIVFRVNGIKIGIGITDANGQAVFYYEDAYKYKVTASFEGDYKYYASSDTYNPEEPVDPGNKSSIASAKETGIVPMKETGIPLIAILLVLFTSIGIIGYRKKE